MRNVRHQLHKTWRTGHHSRARDAVVTHRETRIFNLKPTERFPQLVGAYVIETERCTARFIRTIDT
ncbi:hypothetical protein WI61_29990 [Burkholderia cepacia]|nr:hypothetical protein WI48_19890 [Burkholderia cepacia]KVA58948.1 hypothetical protein WI47_34525 [Burkholderia cepacia]KVA70652.1 hypothetical protein WI49_36380 [Burkholderia cepacia]KVA83036.1 hypothetical protein WI50_21305 [Burkholderia cepacia]KVA94564.1 hypothetical protein WI52_37870 [Burkholderia cepacia]